MHTVAGAVCYDDSYRVLLMRKGKWDGWIIPGGKREGTESIRNTLRREFLQEFSLALEDIVWVGEKHISPREYRPGTAMHYVDYFARAQGSVGGVSAEVDEWGWFCSAQRQRMHLPAPLGILLAMYDWAVESKSKIYIPRLRSHVQG